MKEKRYVSRHQINRLGDRICVWGTGLEAEELISFLEKDVESIECFLDSYRSGSIFRGKPIISFKEYKERQMDLPIVIASYRFADEIAENIDEDSDYYIWDDQHIFAEDESIKHFVEFNRARWEKRKIEGADAQILIPFDNVQSVRSIIHAAYCGDYFAQKHHASIMGYFRFGGTYKNVSPVMKNIYQSINMQDVIDFSLDASQMKEADVITEELWNKIANWEDWKNITIKEIRIGNTMIRHYLRHYLPAFEPKDPSLKRFLHRAVETFVFWFDYLTHHHVKVALMADGVCWDGYIRDIAVSMGIPTYTIDAYFQKLFHNYHRGAHFRYLNKFWNELTAEEQKTGIEWAKEELGKRVHGKTKFLSTSNDLNLFGISSRESGIRKNDKLKIMICPHIFEEDSYWCGKQIFDDNYISWLDHLGELARKTPEYDWYLKLHPSASKRDLMIMDEFLSRYPEISKIDKLVSPKQLHEEGVRWALTVCGTIAQEYPLIGIQVINAGDNPGMAFDFAWNPASKEEYDDLILHLKERDIEKNIQDVYRFYATNFYYYQRMEFQDSDIFFDNVTLEWKRPVLLRNHMNYGTWQYEEYLKENTEEKHLETIKKMPALFEKLDAWDPSTFYRKS